MFIGHVAVGLAAKRFAPRASLGFLVGAPLLLDLLWPIFLLVGLEQVRIDPGNTAFTPFDFVYYPYSHSLAAVLGWATVIAALYHGVTHYWPGTLMIWGGVVSHWILDWIVHRPDLPLTISGDVYVGLGLWNSIPATLIIEVTIFVVGVWLYAMQTRPTDAAGRYGFWSFIIFLVIIYAGNILGTPPPSVTAVALVTMGLWLLVPWMWWVDHHRVISRDELPRSETKEQ